MHANSRAKSPPGWTKPQDCKVLHFTEKRKLLQERDYKAGLDALSPLVTALRAAIEEERRQKERAEEVAEPYADAGVDVVAGGSDETPGDEEDAAN